MKILFLSVIAMSIAVTATAQSTIQSQTIQSEVLKGGNASAYNNTASYKGAGIPIFNPKEDTKGSRYMFSKCIEGTITNSNNEKIQNENYLFNYDKVSQKFIITQDEKTFFAVEDQNVKLYTIYFAGREMAFMKVPAISDDFYVQLLAGKEGNYALYKGIKTKLEKANYTSSGLIENGHNYDEFIDEYTYYIVFPDGKTAKPVSLKKNAVKESLSDEKVKVDAYFAANKGTSVNEEFVKGLIKSLN